MSELKHLIYYRVSTKRQRTSGLGILAQQTIAHHFSSLEGATIVKEVTEIESGKNIDNRPLLNEAIRECNQNGYYLCVAKLDRLSRNVEQTFKILNDLDGRLKAFDLPGKIDIVLLALFSALSQREVEILRLRVKAALSEKKKQGHTLGKPENLLNSHRTKGNEVTTQRSKEFREDRKLVAVVESCVREGMNNHQIAEELNRLGFTTARKKQWNHLSVCRLHLYIKKTNDKS